MPRAKQQRRGAQRMGARRYLRLLAGRARRDFPFLTNAPNPAIKPPGCGRVSHGPRRGASGARNVWGRRGAGCGCSRRTPLHLRVNFVPWHFRHPCVSISTQPHRPVQLHPGAGGGPHRGPATLAGSPFFAAALQPACQRSVMARLERAWLGAAPAREQHSRRRCRRHHCCRCASTKRPSCCPQPA